VRRFAKPESVRYALAILFIAGFASFLFSNSRQAESKGKGFIDPEGKVAAITRTTTEEELIRRFGAKNVKRDDMDIGEAFTEPASFLFPDPARLQVDGGGKSLWSTYSYISLGTSLKELETINAGYFTLAGFAWDYSGTGTSWHGGKLEDIFRKKGRVIVRLSPNVTGSQSVVPESLVGERDIPSSDAAMQKLNPRVYQIIWTFE